MGGRQIGPSGYPANISDIGGRKVAPAADVAAGGRETWCSDPLVMRAGVAELALL
jgi:hypothetical protein